MRGFWRTNQPAHNTFNRIYQNGPPAFEYKVGHRRSNRKLGGSIALLMSYALPRSTVVGVSRARLMLTMLSRVYANGQTAGQALAILATDEKR
jgi:hypothetical protein